MNEPDSLSARILKARYFPDSNILQAQLGSAPSQIWHAIVDGRDTLVQGLIKRIGDGESTRIWSKNWIPREHSMRPLACLSADPPQRVCELLVQQHAMWDQDKLQAVFIHADVEAIMSIPLG